MAGAERCYLSRLFANLNTKPMTIWQNLQCKSIHFVTGNRKINRKCYFIRMHFMLNFACPETSTTRLPLSFRVFVFTRVLYLLRVRSKVPLSHLLVRLRDLFLWVRPYLSLFTQQVFSLNWNEGFFYTVYRSIFIKVNETLS